MPNRVIRDWTDSDRIDGISFQAEVLLLRVMMKADDLGAYHANPKLINSFCFPLKNIRETDISRWLQELVSAGLIALYTADNKRYLHIINFGQRMRTVKPKYPQITENELIEFMTASRQQLVNIPPLEKETEVEEETEEKPKGKSFTPPNLNEVISYFSEKGYTEESAKKAFEYYDTGNWIDGQGNKVNNWKQKMIAVWMKPENKIIQKTESTTPKRKQL